MLWSLPASILAAGLKLPSSNTQLIKFSVGSAFLNITGSFGVATFPQDATSAQQLIRMADERMYAAKKAGRNQVKGRAA